MLDIDVGNTRIKWRIAPSCHGDAPDPVHLIEQIKPSLNHVSRIRIVSVASEQANHVLAEQLKRATELEAEFAVVSPGCGGLVCGYQDYHRLGVDRWAAVCAAWHECQSSCIVVDAGTAVTVDVVDDNGQHLGGYIAPGLTMAQDVLLKKTHGIEFDHRQPTLEPGRDTATAVGGGVLLSILGMIERTVTQSTESLGVRPTIYLTGGNSDLLRGYLQLDMVYKPFLVLDGLKYLLP
ncbi:MAG: type III pantothenate kinase [Pseudomonadales bacterium]